MPGTSVIQKETAGFKSLRAYTHYAVTVLKTRFDDNNNLGEIREKCETGRTPAEGSEKRESHRKIGRVGKYEPHTLWYSTVVMIFLYYLSEWALLKWL